MGNPHVVVPVQDLKAIPFDAWGSALEIDPLFPAKTNVHFLEVIDSAPLRSECGSAVQVQLSPAVREPAPRLLPQRFSAYRSQKPL